MLAKSKASASRPAIPSLFLSNVRALDNKMDLLRLRVRQKEMKDCCVTVFTETWLSNIMPESAFQLDDQIFFRSDCYQLSGKTKGGGLCIYVNRSWCTICLLVRRH